MEKLNREWLKELRIRKNMTQSQISEACGISLSYYSLIENGERDLPVKTAKKIAKALKFKWSKFYS